MEQFKDIPQFGGLYQASDLGNIKSLVGKPRIMKLFTSYGYLRVNISIKCNKKNYLVHRLVLSAFKGESELQCNHKDGIRTNNKLDNLEWMTQSENMLHRSHVLGFKTIFQTNHPNKGKFGKLHHNSKEILQISLKGKIIRKWASIAEAGLTLNVQKSHISSCCQGKRKTTGGYKWEYFTNQ